MPIDTSPFIDPASTVNTTPTLPPWFNDYVPPTTGGQQPGKDNKSILEKPWFNPDIGGGMLFGGLFGKDEGPSWKPYLDSSGNWVWADPNKKNPVPRATLPGAPLSPNKNYRNTAGDMQAVVDLMPYLAQAINSSALPGALSELQVSQITSPAYAELMTQLYNKYGPQLNAIGNEIIRRNALAQAETDNAVLTGPGKQTVKSAYDLAQVFDKPYYDTRQLSADNLKKLMDSIDLTGALSEGERREVEQGLAREGQRSGTLNSPSQSQTVANAMRYGEKGYQRQQTAKSNLSQALQNASAFLPTSKSGVDVFQVATGKPSQVNPGAGQFTGVDRNSGNTNAQYGLAGSLLSGMNSSNINAANIKANEKDWLDKFNQFASGLGSLTGSATSAAGMIGLCWVAREVFGEDAEEWRLFRRWMYERAPMWLFSLYLKKGEKFSNLIKDKPNIKRFLKKLMLLAINN